MEDLSHLCPVGEALIGGSSMSAGNTVSISPAIAGGPGTPPANPLPPGAEPDRAVAVNVGPEISYVKKVGK